MKERLTKNELQALYRACERMESYGISIHDGKRQAGFVQYPVLMDKLKRMFNQLQEKRWKVKEK